jgi:hypothetical protein
MVVVPHLRSKSNGSFQASSNVSRSLLHFSLWDVHLEVYRSENEYRDWESTTIWPVPSAIKQGKKNEPKQPRITKAVSIEVFCGQTQGKNMKGINGT